MLYTTSNTEETENLGRSLALKLDALCAPHVFIALFGEMGVGKTAFVRGFASAFDIFGVKSPTYTVVNEYRGRKNVYHFDMYRIESEDDLYSIGFDDYIERDGFAIVEWSENIKELLPEDIISVRISRDGADPDKRNIEIESDGKYENISI